MKKKIAVIGSNRGIGLEFVKQLQNNHDVYAFCRHSSDELKQTSAKVIEDFEVTDSASIAAGLRKVEGATFDRLIHVSGIYLQDSLATFSEEEVCGQFAVNSLAPLVVARAFLPLLNKEAKIALLTSRMGSIADNTSGNSYGYRMSKAALNAGGKSLAEDLKSKKFTVLLLHPGYVKTDMTGHHGSIEPPEAVRGMIKIIEEKNLTDTGTFWHTNGERLPW